MINGNEKSFRNDPVHSRQNYWKYMFFMICAVMGGLLCWGYKLKSENKDLKKEIIQVLNEIIEEYRNPREPIAPVYGPPPVEESRAGTIPESTSSSKE